MANNQAFFVKYKDNQPVKIETHYVGEQERRRPLSDVCDVIRASTSDSTRRLLGLPDDYGPLILHAVVDGVESVLPGNQTLFSIPTPSCSFANPLIIKTLGANVLECPLYQLSFISTSEASTDSRFSVVPESVAHWNEFEELVSAFSSPLQKLIYQVPSDSIVGIEESMYPHFSSLFLWAKEALVAPGELILSDYLRANVIGRPDFFFVNRGYVYLTFEVKRPLMLPSALRHLAEIFSDQFRTDPTGGLVKAVCQEFGYMVVCTLFRFAAL
ncbi:UNVERIFIED_CONTAM: hypothetical protein HDU68_002960 [Siphonaria sp. JEL0065]|nr:hypothetical protein HDU68_002960 [Siphonaria sp. JEL0065]